MTDLPNYRAHVIARLSSSAPHNTSSAAAALRILDNKEITAVERKKAEMTAKKEETVMNLMYSNECLIKKLKVVT